MGLFSGFKISGRATKYQLAYDQFLDRLMYKSPTILKLQPPERLTLGIDMRFFYWNVIAQYVSKKVETSSDKTGKLLKESYKFYVEIDSKKLNPPQGLSPQELEARHHAISTAIKYLTEEHLLKVLLATCFSNCSPENTMAIENEIGNSLNWILEPAREAVYM